MTDSPVTPNTMPRGVSVIIPCLNEAKSIAQVIQAAQTGLAVLPIASEIIVVDNGCTDRTAAIASDHGARVVRESRRGYGAAIRRGFAEARFDILVMGDGDQTYDFSDLPRLVQPILDDDADFVIGNRMKDIRPGSMPALHRYIGNPVLSMLLRMLFGSHAVRDAHCGMRAIQAEAYRRLNCLTTGMEFASEMVIAAIRNDLRIKEVDIVYHPRVGESKLRSFKDGWR
ncbi:MAG: glycosyltransferase family 2 protein, partial [Verrucomicrobia bacterium]|nr:glycosyltransferase family 2 protein [Verrucomicrobiota bacterium]